MSGGGKGGSGGGGSQTVTTKVNIPDFLKPLANQQADAASGALRDFQQGEQTAGFNEDQLAAFNQARGIAGGEGGFLPAAQQQLLQTAQGDFLESDSFNNAFQSALRQAQPEISSAFSLAGRSGSGLESTAQSQAAANAFANLFGQERQRQLQAAQALPSAALAGSNILQQIGGQQQAQEQRELGTPLQLLQAAGGPISLGSFLGQTQQQPFHGPSSLMQGLGGAASGAGIGGAIGGPLGAGIGAGAGGLIGILG